jgi:hypothetical protein
MLSASGAPHFEARHSAENDQRLPNGACGSMHENALSSPHPGRAMQELVCGGPAQDQGGCLGRVNASRHAGQVLGLERAIDRVRADHSHIGNAIANLKSADAIAELIDFSDKVITHYEWWPAGRSLRVEVTPDQRVGVLQARREDTDSHLALARFRQWNVDHVEAVDITKPPDLNDPVA